MNYRKIYESLIEKRKNEIFEGYGENHHILPKCLGGSDDPSNIVRLTAKEHYIAHLLLCKIHSKGPNHWKMVKSFVMMGFISKNQNRYKPERATSRLYENLRKDFSKIQSIAMRGKNNSQYGSFWGYDEKTYESRKFRNGDELPEGWCRGRVMSKEKGPCEQYKYRRIKSRPPHKINLRIPKTHKFLVGDKSGIFVNKNLFGDNISKTTLNTEAFRDQAQIWYSKLVESGLSVREFVRTSDYDKSYVTFIYMLKKYVKEYTSDRYGTKLK